MAPMTLAELPPGMAAALKSLVLRRLRYLFNPDKMSAVVTAMAPESATRGNIVNKKNFSR
jgi:hypothetical protein